MAAKSNRIGSPRLQVRLNDDGIADLEAVQRWLEERMAAPTVSDVIRAALRYTAEGVKKNPKKIEKKC